LCDSCVKTSQRAEMRRLRHAVEPACGDEPTNECWSRADSGRIHL